MNSGKVLLGLLAGLAAGAVLGILLAPDKGSNTRSKLLSGAKDLAEDLKKRMKEEASSLRIKAGELEDLAKGKIEDLTNSVTQKADAFKQHN